MGSKRKRSKLSVRRSRQDPFSLLVRSSTLMYLTDPRRTGRFATPEPVDRARVVASMIEESTSRSSAILAVLAEVIDDDKLANQIRAELVARRAAEPMWVARLGETQIERAMLLSHVLDSDDVVLL